MSRLGIELGYLGFPCESSTYWVIGAVPAGDIIHFYLLDMVVSFSASTIHPRWNYNIDMKKVRDNTTSYRVFPVDLEIKNLARRKIT